MTSSKEMRMQSMECSKISINIFDKFKVSGVAVPDGIAYAHAAASLFDNLGDYKEILERGESEESLKAEKVQICANIMGAFGTLTGEIEILAPLSVPLTYGADCLHADADEEKNIIAIYYLRYEICVITYRKPMYMTVL